MRCTQPPISISSLLGNRILCGSFAEFTDMSNDEVTDGIIGAAIAVHRELGPGLLESTYSACLAVELAERGLGFERQAAVPVVYKGKRIECGYRIDFFVERIVIVELKSVTRLEPIHAAQMLTYLKLSGCTVGLLINFNDQLLKDGIRRLVLNLPEPSPRPPRSLR